jgi:hypothetical protein
VAILTSRFSIGRICDGSYWTRTRARSIDLALIDLLAAWRLKEDGLSSRSFLPGDANHVADGLHDLRVGAEEPHRLVQDLRLSAAKFLVADALLPGQDAGQGGTAS